MCLVDTHKIQKTVEHRHFHDFNELKEEKRQQQHKNPFPLRGKNVNTEGVCGIHTERI